MRNVQDAFDMLKVVKKYETYMTVVKFAKFAIAGALIVLALTGVLPLNGGNTKFEKF